MLCPCRVDETLQRRFPFLSFLRLKNVGSKSSFSGVVLNASVWFRKNKQAPIFLVRDDASARRLHRLRQRPRPFYTFIPLPTTMSVDPTAKLLQEAQDISKTEPQRAEAIYRQILEQANGASGIRIHIYAKLKSMLMTYNSSCI